MFLEKCSKCGANHLDRGVFASQAQKKHIFTVWNHVGIVSYSGVSNPLACFQPSLLDD